jgi:hypothetical protein
LTYWGGIVVVAFFGGETLEIKKYIPASLENFENGLLDNMDVEDFTLKSSQKKSNKLELLKKEGE